MRHGKKFNHLGRKTAHRKAMLSNMASSLIEHKRITTTVAKAKALRQYVEPLINRSKEDSTHSRRMVFRYLGNKSSVTELFREVAPKVGNREGGYTRIIKLGHRQGDAAEMCMIELVDFNEIYGNEEKKTKTRRARRGGGKSKVAAAADTVKDAAETATDKAADAAEAAADKVSDAAEAVADKAADVADAAADKAEDIKDATEDATADKKKDDKSGEEKA